MSVIPSPSNANHKAPRLGGVALHVRGRSGVGLPAPKGMD